MSYDNNQNNASARFVGSEYPINHGSERSSPAGDYRLQKVIYPNYLTIATVLAWLAVASGIVSIGLVSAWAKDDTSNEIGFLGKPNWADNPFPWHPVLFVGGTFFAMVLAISAWTFNDFYRGDKILGKLYHFFLMCAAVFCLGIGLAAVVKSIDESNSDSLTTMHSWIGVATITLFGLSFVIGCFMSFLTHVTPDSSLRSLIAWLPTHKLLGSLTFTFFVISIQTGIMDQLSRGACNYTTAGSTTTNDSGNIASNYKNIPSGCKIGNGLGMVVLMTAVFVFLSVYFRAQALQKW